MTTTRRVVVLDGRRCAALCGAGALLLAGCGGGLPLLHPAQALEKGETRASAGFSGEVAALGFADSLRDANRDAAQARGQYPAAAPGGEATLARGALVAASIAPGLAPWVGARVGLGDRYEAGLGYTGRAVRADVRRSFDLDPHWALSIGAGGSAALYGRQEGETLPGLDLRRLRGWGADLPVLIGYTSDGELYALWLGARVGWEQVEISGIRSAPSAQSSGGGAIALSATRFWGGGVLGLAIGFRHVHVAMEIDVAYANIAGEYNAVHVQLNGVSLAPATCLWWRF